MSLTEKWEEYAKGIVFIDESDRYAAQRAYYAGAEAALDNWGDMTEIDSKRAEIDRFKGLKTDAND